MPCRPGCMRPGWHAIVQCSGFSILSLVASHMFSLCDWSASRTCRYFAASAGAVKLRLWHLLLHSIRRWRIPALFLPATTRHVHEPHCLHPPAGLPRRHGAIMHRASRLPASAHPGLPASRCCWAMQRSTCTCVSAPAPLVLSPLLSEHPATAVSTSQSADQTPSWLATCSGASSSSSIAD